MIHYALQCRRGHGFDGWFADSAAFERQVGHGLVECPVCADTKVTRALMAPAVLAKSTVPQVQEEASPPAPETPPAPPVAVAGEKMPDQMRAALARLRAEVERNCDYVGTEFAAVARRIHRGEQQARGIYGETTPEQAEALEEEGIDIARIPWVPRADG